MPGFVDEAVGRMRDRGLRVTTARRAVLTVLAEADRALSPYGIIERLEASHEAPDVVTVYRILATLEELRLVHRVHSLNGYIACSHLTGDGCHHPIICAKCGKIGEFEGHGEPQLHVQELLPDWRVTGHVLEFTGLCPECRRQEEG